MSIPTNRIAMAVGLAAAATLLAVPAMGVSIFFETAPTNNPGVTGVAANMGEVELFSYGPFGGVGTWGADQGAAPGMPTNEFGVLTAVQATQGGVGFSAHVAYPAPFISNGHGLLVPGNVCRFSMWVADDPSYATIPNQDWEYAVMKLEVYTTELSGAHANACQNLPEMLYESDWCEPKKNQDYRNVANTNDWTQVVFEYTHDVADFDESLVGELRFVITHGDFRGIEYDGNVLVDNVRVEVFNDQAHADATPIDTTNPGALPEPVAIVPAAQVPLVSIGQTNSVLITFDAQLGVNYKLEFSPNGGANWLPTLLPPVTGDGTRMSVFDPAGPSLTKIYRLVPTPTETPPSS